MPVTDPLVQMLSRLQNPQQFQMLLEELSRRGVAINPQDTHGYANRNIAGTNTRSRHATGEAVDVNATRNPFGRSTASTQIDPATGREMAQRFGMTWGGDWRTPDAMHFQLRRRGEPPPGGSLGKDMTGQATSVAGQQPPQGDLSFGGLPGLQGGSMDPMMLGRMFIGLAQDPDKWGPILTQLGIPPPAPSPTGGPPPGMMGTGLSDMGALGQPDLTGGQAVPPATPPAVPPAVPVQAPPMVASPPPLLDLNSLLGVPTIGANPPPEVAPLPGALPPAPMAPPEDPNAWLTALLTGAGGMGGQGGGALDTGNILAAGQPETHALTAGPRPPVGPQVRAPTVPAPIMSGGVAGSQKVPDVKAPGGPTLASIMLALLQGRQNQRPQPALGPVAY